MTSQDERIKAQIKEKKEQEMSAKAYDKARTYPETPTEPDPKKGIDKGELGPKWENVPKKEQ